MVLVLLPHADNIQDSMAIHGNQTHEPRKDKSTAYVKLNSIEPVQKLLQ